MILINKMDSVDEIISEYEQVFNDHIWQNSGVFPLGFILLAQEYKIYFVRENDDELVVDICKAGTLLHPYRLRWKKDSWYINIRYFINMVLRNFESMLYLKEVESCWPNFDIDARIPIFEKYWRRSILLNDN